jgi:hypothetical protein
VPAKARQAATLGLLVLAAGCGTPTTVPAQAEALAAIAAEGTLLANDTAEGTSLGPFTRVHAEALRKEADTLRAAIDEPALEAIAGAVVDALGRLPDDPARAADALESAEKAAEELAG